MFGQYARKLPPAAVDGEALLSDVKDFQRESLAGRYYEPFEINSKNWMHVPEETDEWFERMGELLAASARLTGQGDHAPAVALSLIKRDSHQSSSAQVYASAMQAADKAQQAHL